MKIKPLFFALLFLPALVLLSGCQKNYIENGGVQDLNDSEELIEAQLEEGANEGDWEDLEEEELDLDSMSDEELLEELESMGDVFTDDISELDSEI
jgi:hypothetical protein